MTRRDLERPDRAAAEVVTTIQNLDRRALALGADVSSPDQVESMFATIGKEFGEVSILVNNADVALLHSVPHGYPSCGCP
jgi:NAD(P)-dependent dehydrogenase (short-subunit alcohol dehydrogenase family)